jgi:hypothetical protein
LTGDVVRECRIEICFLFVGETVEGGVLRYGVEEEVMFETSYNFL